MDKAYLVIEEYNNGKLYDEEYESTEVLHGFPTYNEAKRFIKEMDIPTNWVDATERFKEADEEIDFRVFEYHHTEHTSQSIYSIKEIPFG